MRVRPRPVRLHIPLPMRHAQFVLGLHDGFHVCVVAHHNALAAGMEDASLYQRHELCPFTRWAPFQENMTRLEKARRVVGVLPPVVATVVAGVHHLRPAVYLKT